MNTKDFNINLNNKHILFTLSSINSNNQSKHTIASIYFIRDDITMNTELLRNNLKFLNINTLNVFYISDLDIYKTMENKFYFNEPRQLLLQIIDYTGFKKLISSNNFNELNQNSLFILDNQEWSHIVKLCITSDASITISGGSGTKRHIVSKLDARFISYLLAIFNLDSNKLIAFNNFDSVEKNYYLPYMDFSNKKQLRVINSSGNINVFDLKSNKED